MNKTPIRKGQLWKSKSGGYMFRIYRGKGDEWFGLRSGISGNNPVGHHITAWDLRKFWELV